MMPIEPMNKLRVLHIENLPDSLVITDLDLMERISRKFSSLSNLAVCDMAKTTPETKRAMLTLILIIFESETTPSTLKFESLGLETS